MTAKGATIRSGKNPEGHHTGTLTRMRRLREALDAVPHHAGERAPPATRADELSVPSSATKSTATTPTTNKKAASAPPSTSTQALVPPPSTGTQKTGAQQTGSQQTGAQQTGAQQTGTGTPQKHVMYLLDRHCEYPGCDKVFLGDDGTCEYCMQVRCITHDALPYHECGTHDWNVVQEVQIRAERAMWGNFLRPLENQGEVLAAQAVAHRPGRSCRVIIPASLEELYDSGLFNQCNGHVPVLFDDGVEWLVRIRQVTKRSPTTEMQRMITASEVETMRLMNAAGMKVPNAWPVPEADLIQFKPGVTFDYFFVERVRGCPWPQTYGADEGEIPSPEILEAFVDDYARFQLGVLELPFRGGGIGSLFPGRADDQSPTLGPLVTHFCFNRPESPHFLGPFKTNSERYLTHIDLILEMIEAGRYHLNDPVFGYVAHLHMRDVVCSLDELANCETDFYIKHPDDKADQCLAAEGHITGVIDWEWAYVTTKAEAFSAPKFAFGSPGQRKGDNTPSNTETLLVSAYERLNRPDLADCVRKGRIYNRLNSMIGYEPLFYEINALTRAAYGEDATETIFDSKTSWIAAAKERYSGNEVLQRLILADEGKAEARAARFTEDVARLTAWDRQMYGEYQDTSTTSENDRVDVDTFVDDATAAEVAATAYTVPAAAEIPLPPAMDGEL